MSWQTLGHERHQVPQLVDPLNLFDSLNTIDVPRNVPHTICLEHPDVPFWEGLKTGFIQIAWLRRLYAGDPFGSRHRSFCSGIKCVCFFSFDVTQSFVQQRNSQINSKLVERFLACPHPFSGRVAVVRVLSLDSLPSLKFYQSPNPTSVVLECSVSSRMI